MIGQIVGLLVGTVGLGGLIAIGLLLWIASNPANAERVAYWFASAFRFVSKKAEETALKTDVTHRINDFAVRMSRNVEGYSPPGLEVKFVEGVEPNAFMNEGRLVVRLHARSERDHNFL